MCFMGKLTISMAIFNSYVTNYQRVPTCCDLFKKYKVSEKWSNILKTGMITSYRQDSNSKRVGENDPAT